MIPLDEVLSKLRSVSLRKFVKFTVILRTIRLLLAALYLIEMHLLAMISSSVLESFRKVRI